jgi:hypothetical protein
LLVNFLLVCPEFNWFLGELAIVDPEEQFNSFRLLQSGLDEDAIARAAQDRRRCLKHFTLLFL